MKLYSHVECEKYKKYNCINRSEHPYTLDTDSFSTEVDPIERKSCRAVAETASFGALTLARVDTTGPCSCMTTHHFC